MNATRTVEPHPQAIPKMKMTTDIPPEITTPNSVETRLGTLNFFDGFPDDATVEKAFDNLDFQRGVQAFLTAMPGASAPDERMKAILTESVAVGNATARAILFKSRIKDAYFFPNSAWCSPFVGGSYEFLKQPGVRNLAARTMMFYYATGITPAMAMQMVGIGSQYAAAFTDSEGKALDGSKTYKVHLPPNIPAKSFWSFVLYDNQTRSMLQTDEQFPSIGSQKKDIVINSDTSVDVYFGPTAPAGHEANWVQTVPGKGWNTLLRLYGPLQPWFDKTWKPGEIELLT